MFDDGVERRHGYSDGGCRLTAGFYELQGWLLITGTGQACPAQLRLRTACIQTGHGGKRGGGDGLEATQVKTTRTSEYEIFTVVVNFEVSGQLLLKVLDMSNRGRCRLKLEHNLT